MENLSLEDQDCFWWKEFQIYQSERVFKAGTDSILLGSWIPRIVSGPGLILDAGTGSGILALMMKAHFPAAIIHGVDVDSMALDLARKNVYHASKSGDVFIREEDILERTVEKELLFDLIISNPPYYTSNNPPKVDHKARSKHSRGPVGGWMHGLLNRITPGGHVAIIVPSKTSSAWIHSANEKGFYIRDRLDVYSFAEDQEPVRSLLHFTQTIQRPDMTSMIIYERNKDFTSGYQDLTGIRKD